MPTLFDPIRLGDMDLPNRVIMAPLTRIRADPATRAPTDLVAEPYVQRSCAGISPAEAPSVASPSRRTVWVPSCLGPRALFLFTQPPPPDSAFIFHLNRSG